MALTVDTLLAAMRTARALHLHCRRIVFWNGRFAPAKSCLPAKSHPTAEAEEAQSDAL
jgi:hypothetical protein